MPAEHEPPAQGERTLEGRTLIMSGGSRGIGLAIALRAAADGANVAIIAKTAEPHPKLEGTIYTAAKAIEDAGGHALPVIGDVRNDEDIAGAVTRTVEQFGGIDICVNNASAINLAGVDGLAMKGYDLMQDINVRGSYALSKAAVAHLRRGRNPHILTLSPPINLESRWLAPHTAYTIAKYGMTLCALGLAEELRSDGIASNALWPRTLVATAAVKNLLGGDTAMNQARTPAIYADAAHVVLTSDSTTMTGRALLCEDVLVGAGVVDLGPYSNGSTEDLAVDLFVDEVNPPGY